MAQHFITKCSCGAVLAQCRCPSQDKTVSVVEGGCDNCHKPNVAVEFTAPNYIVVTARQPRQTKELHVILDDEQAKFVMRQLHGHFHGED